MNFSKIKHNITNLNIARFIIIAYSIFIGLLALDTKLSTGLIIHLIPSLIVLGTLIFTWKKQKLAGISFIIEGIITIFFYNTYLDTSNFILISLPLIASGIIFYCEK
jgi:hypothetical protein